MLDTIKFYLKKFYISEKYDICKGSLKPSIYSSFFIRVILVKIESVISIVESKFIYIFRIYKIFVNEKLFKIIIMNSNFDKTIAVAIEIHFLFYQLLTKDHLNFVCKLTVSQYPKTLRISLSQIFHFKLSLISHLNLKTHLTLLKFYQFCFLNNHS